MINCQAGTEFKIFLRFSGINLSTKVDEAVRESGFEDSVENRHLADKMKSYLLSSKSDNTNKKYYFAYKKWKQFITKKVNQICQQILFIVRFT